jgi:hypothetical protein
MGMFMAHDAGQSLDLEPWLQHQTIATSLATSFMVSCGVTHPDTCGGSGVVVFRWPEKVADDIIMAFSSF